MLVTTNCGGVLVGWNEITYISQGVNAWTSHSSVKSFCEL